MREIEELEERWYDGRGRARLALMDSGHMILWLPDSLGDDEDAEIAVDAADPWADFERQKGLAGVHWYPPKLDDNG